MESSLSCHAAQLSLTSQVVVVVMVMVVVVVVMMHHRLRIFCACD
jgi:hypothetical protein